MKNLMTPGDRVRAHRKHFGWSQKSLAERAGVSGGTVKMVENGYRGSRETRDRIAAALGETHDSLFAPVK